MVASLYKLILHLAGSYCLVAAHGSLLSFKLLGILKHEPSILQVFSKAAFETHGRYFRSLLFSSERKSGHKHLLRFCFILPPAEAMDELARWLAAVMVLIDVIGTYKLSPEQKKRADKVRGCSHLQMQNAPSSVLVCI